ncbi:MAG TPA: type IV pilus biogenesis protein PilP [Noviherbaspirillum sp.]
MPNNPERIIFLAALLSCSAVLADPTSDKLTEIEAETLLLKAREKQLDVQASILAKQNEIARQNAGGQIVHSAVADDPIVQGVEGLGKDVFATLQFNDGTIIDVKAGDVLSNGMRVVSVAPSNVIVQKGKKRIRLSHYVPRQASFNTNLPSPGTLLPLPAAAPKGFVR